MDHVLLLRCRLRHLRIRNDVALRFGLEPIAKPDRHFLLAFEVYEL